MHVVLCYTIVVQDPYSVLLGSDSEKAEKREWPLGSFW